MQTIVYITRPFISLLACLLPGHFICTPHSKGWVTNTWITLSRPLPILLDITKITIPLLIPVPLQLSTEEYIRTLIFLDNPLIFTRNFIGSMLKEDQKWPTNMKKLSVPNNKNRDTKSLQKTPTIPENNVDKYIHFVLWN